MLGRNGIRRLSASILALVVSLASATVASAQAGATITGRVTSEAGQPLYGANITIEALTISVGTNEEGRYTMTIPGARARAAGRPPGACHWLRAGREDDHRLGGVADA